MSRYRRNLVPGGTYFFTVNVRDRSSSLLVEQIAALREAVRLTRAEMPFQIDAWVVLPEHVHCVWTLPAGDADYPARWQAIKSRFSHALPATEPRTAVMRRRADRGIWQMRYWEHTIRDTRDYVAHVDYVHFNPVKHGLVADAGSWPYSTFHRAVARGAYPPDWSGPMHEPEKTGEP